MKNKSFFGGVIYIDLRGYTDIVEDKAEETIKFLADFIYDYQQKVTSLTKQLFKKNNIATIEYMGDGILIILMNQTANMNDRNFAINIYENAKNIKESMVSFISNKKRSHPDIFFLKKLDFGMGIACSNIFRKVSTSNSRELFFGTSLNRASTIGDSMKKEKNNLGISLDMFQLIGTDYFVLDSTKHTNTNLEKELYVWINDVENIEH